MESEKVMKMSGRKLKDMVFNNIMLKIGSVILAIVLWLLVININDPQVTASIKDIPVRILNEEAITSNNEVYDILSGDTIDIKITGPRTIVDALRRDDFTATADFNDLSKTNAVPIDVSINSLRYESKVTISEKSRNAMRLSVNELIEKEYEVGVQRSGNPAYGYVLYQTYSETPKIVIKAPEAAHRNIAEVTAYISLSGNEIDDFLKQGDIRLLDGERKLINLTNNHITLSSGTVSVRGIVYSRKNVDIICNVPDKLSDGRIVTGHSVSADSVDIVGKKQALEAVGSITLPEYMMEVPDDAAVNEHGEIELRPDLKTLLPEGVYIYDSDGIITLKINVENEERMSLSIQPGEIGIRKIPEGYRASIRNTDGIEIVLSGLRSHLNELDMEKLAPYVDLTDAHEGENLLTLNVVLPDGISQVSEIKVTVVLTGREQTPTEENTTTAPKQEETMQTQETTEPPEETDTTVEEEKDTTEEPEI